MSFSKKDNGSQATGRFYDETTDKFLAVYGEVIQAFRTRDVSSYLDYTIASAELQPGMSVVDAGCGVCGPATYFASQLEGLTVNACTVSKVQVEKAKANIEAKGLTGRVKVHLADYHHLPEILGEGIYDRIIFLESFGHSKDKDAAIHSAWEALRPGGKLYIKDLFSRESSDEWEQLHIDRICGQINDAYHYQIGDLHEVLSALRRQGFTLEFLRIPKMPIEEFEHLTISNDFQNIFGIGKIDSWDGYVFPIDFFEILAQKPAFNLQSAPHLYHMNR